MRRAWLLLAFAAALVLWLWRSPREEVTDNQAPNEGRAPEPGYVATGAILFETDNNGQPVYRLFADRIAQPDLTANIQLTAPQFVYQGTTVWTLTAQQISLSGDVYAEGVRTGAEPLHIRSATLNVDMTTRQADTSDPVTMDWGTNKLWSHGMNADMQTNHLRLISPVYGEFSRRKK